MVVLKNNFLGLLKHALREIDIISNIVKTPERESFVLFSEPYFSPPTTVFTRKNSLPITKISDLNNKRVAVENQFHMHERLKNEFPEIILLAVKDTVTALKQVSAGKVDAYIGNQGAATWIIEQNSLSNLKVALVASELGTENQRFAVRKDWILLQGILDKALVSISEADMFLLRRKWFGEASKEKVKD